MNGTGVLNVCLVQSKRYAYRLHFARAIAPEWVLENLKDLSDNIYDPDPEDDEVEIIGGSDRVQVVMQSIKSVEDAWNELAVKQEKIDIETLEETEIEE